MKCDCPCHTNIITPHYECGDCCEVWFDAENSFERKDDLGH